MEVSRTNLKLTIKVKPGAGRNEVTQLDEFEYEVRTTAPPEKGKANKAVIEELAEYLHVAKSRLRIVAGHASKSKIVELL